nr:reverse transcriptase domain-containing protein [Tanacetum cinerariifolium]
MTKWYGPFMVKHGCPSGYIKLYYKHDGSFIVNGHRVKLYHDEEQLNKISSKRISLACGKKKIKAFPLMELFPKDYTKIMPWASKNPLIYDVAPNVCNEAKLYDIDETCKGIVKGNFLYFEESSEEVLLEET